MWAACQVSPEESEAVVCFLCGRGYMRVHGHLLVDMDSEVCSSLHFLEIPTMDGVGRTDA
ncbi:hypothetical protein DPMN_067139 [Dreissena polymorpha]|uniref:Uncharacterized protein n=1 Tax=Dreissena polymorpha TaxID=45954 RepID=A0A9D3YVB5_DREPO|nr:hypothetical protein DPMN_067139 [Dreissena polymorpha]